MTERVIATVTDYDGMVAAIRGRQAELGLTDATIDHLAGWAGGYCGKLLGAAHVKTLGQTSLGELLQTLALKIVIVEDEAARAKMEARWEKRERPASDTARTASLGKTTMRRVFPTIAREMQKRSRDSYRHITKASTRRRVAKQAARARWGKPRRQKRKQGQQHRRSV